MIISDAFPRKVHQNVSTKRGREKFEVRFCNHERNITMKHLEHTELDFGKLVIGLNLIDLLFIAKVTQSLK